MMVSPWMLMTPEQQAQVLMQQQAAQQPMLAQNGQTQDMQTAAESTRNAFNPVKPKPSPQPTPMPQSAVDPYQNLVDVASHRPRKVRQP